LTEVNWRLRKKNRTYLGAGDGDPGVIIIPGIGPFNLLTEGIEFLIELVRNVWVA